MGKNLDCTWNNPKRSTRAIRHWRDLFQFFSVPKPVIPVGRTKKFSTERKFIFKRFHWRCFLAMSSALEIASAILCSFITALKLTLETLLRRLNAVASLHYLPCSILTYFDVSLFLLREIAKLFPLFSKLIFLFVSWTCSQHIAAGKLAH